jgi:hypothetical protein
MPAPPPAAVNQKPLQIRVRQRGLGNDEACRPNQHECQRNSQPEHDQHISKRSVAPCVK